MGPSEWEREWWFKGGSGHLSRIEHLDLDWFTSMKANSDVFRLGRIYARDSYDSEMWHLRYCSCDAIDSDLLKVPRKAKQFNIM